MSIPGKLIARAPRGVKRTRARIHPMQSAASVGAETNPWSLVFYVET
jgi:hypothetical protein